MYAIEAKKLCKKYGDKAAVSDLSLTIDQGELFALLGTNGAGKTTTIKMLTTLIQPTSGDALIQGSSIRTDSTKVRQLSNVSPQENAVGTKLTVRENLEFIARIYGAKGSEVKEKANSMIEKFDMQEVAKQRAGTLSGGWQRRLSIAMALITDPEVLYLDEPTLGLDVLARRELWEVIRQLKGKVTMILTTHYLEEAEALSDRIGIMAKSKLKKIGTAAELKEYAGTDNFEEAFIKIAEEAVV